MNKDESRKVMTVEEVAELLKVTERTVRSAINDGELQAYKRFGKWYVFFSDVEDYIRSGQSSTYGERNT